VPENQRLLVSRPWVLVYTDSTATDNTNTVHYFHLPAVECEKKEFVTFAANGYYNMHLYCDQTATNTLTGFWSLWNDSTLGYGLSSDTSTFVPGRIAKIQLITSDTLKLIQVSGFAQPYNDYHTEVEKTYMH
jgi:hypothetical protein